MADVIVRRLRDPQEFIDAVKVQRLAWRMEDYREASPAHLLKALSDNGGLVLGLFYEGKLIGVSYGWPTSYYFYSHATGVIETEKYRGLGRKLKLAQREEVLREYGLSLAKWTFDPLQSLNSRFNLSKLGVIVTEYLIDYYGEIRDPINRGLGTDRARAEWWLTSPRVLERIKGSRTCLHLLQELNPISAYGVEHKNGILLPGAKRSEDELLSSEIILVPIPRNISALRDASIEAARKWRYATRWVYNLAINNGYILVDNIDGGINYTINVLWKSSVSNILSSPEPWRRCED